MKETEEIPVFVKIKDGKTICLCHAGAKRCKRNCTRDVVSRDKFDGWQETMKRSRYGR